ncbi:MAG: carboxymuconolactone decarboxylase family protein, partial [Salinirussus sp.]
FRESRGFLDADVRSILETDAAFFEHYLDISSIPARTGALDPVMRSLIAVAVDAAGTTLYTRGVRTHVRTALERGATPEHVAGVIEIASILGSHTLIESAGILLEEAERRGVLPDDR